MKAKDILECLCSKTDAWLRPLCIKEFPFVAKMATPPQAILYSEVTVRIPTGEKTRFGKDKPQRRRYDAVLLVKPFYKAWGYEFFNLGIEVKISKSDLLNDEKLLDYLGYTDYFFFCVPEDLQEQAIIKRNSNSHIGIIVVGDSGCRIVTFPERQQITSVHSMELYRELAIKHMLTHFNDGN